MKTDNYISFAVVNGFFIGFIISILKFDEPEVIIIATVFSTIIFYMIILISSSIFVGLFDVRANLLKKQRYDETLDYFVEEFDRREKLSKKIREFIKSLDLGADRELGLQQNKEKA